MSATTINVRSPDPAPRLGTEFARDVVAGLSSEPKSLPPKYFYDVEGSRLFDEITTLPEYYLTRAELAILSRRAGTIGDFIPKGAALIEFGSGSAIKIRAVLRAAPHIAAYVPVDISGSFLEQEAASVARDFPALAVFPVAADFARSFALPPPVEAMARVGFFPGSTIGNFEPHEAAAFLKRAATVLGETSKIIVGVDLEKDAGILRAAYNDAAGVTARFNLNLLTRINRELGANFDLAGFEHHAFYNRVRRRVEMHLASRRRQKVQLCGKTFAFRAGETIHTENSYKYTMASFTALARGSGWMPSAVFVDPERLFSVHLLAHEAI